MTSSTKFGLSAVFGVLALLPAAHASALYTLDRDACTGTCGTAPFGTGAGKALEFNVAGPVTIGSITAGFAAGPAPATASAFGTFLESVACTSCQGGRAGNPAGPLSFTVTSASGVTIANFIANSSGYFFASDIVGNNCNTGNVAAIDGSTVPEPLSLSLVGAGLLGLGLLRRRF